MATKDNTQIPEKQGLLSLIRKFFVRKNSSSTQEKESSPKNLRRLEPKYWQEVIDFMETLDHLIKTYTIEDDNLRHVNQRIVDYVQEQINLKGSIKDIEERYSALDTLADRILTNNLSKIVGLKHTESSQAEFTEAIINFKKRLHHRYLEELNEKQRQG